MKVVISSYWKIYRIVFVVLFLYLMGDAFYRWDGISYYASFLEFLPGVALISVLWSIVAVLISILIWLAFGIVKLALSPFPKSAKTAHCKTFIYLLAFFGTVIFIAKRLLIKVAFVFQVKLLIVICTIFLAILVTWLLRNKNEQIKRWSVGIQESITPLVWLFSIFIILSIIIVPHSLLTKKNIEITAQTRAWELLLKGRSSTVKESLDNNLYQNTPQFPSANKSRPNIILVTYDSLTARNMSCYGYDRKTTPFIDEWAKNATLFKRAIAESNHSNSTLATLMTGNRTWTHNRFQQAIGTKLINNDMSSLPLLLKKNGYFNMALVANPLGDPYVLGISDSFDIAPPVSEFRLHTYLFGYIKKLLYDLFHDKILFFDWFYREDFILYKLAPAQFKYLTKTEFPPDMAFNKFFDLYDKDIPEPFFVWIHVMPPHDPYVPPEPYIGMFNSSDKFRTAAQYERFTDQKHKFLKRFKNMHTLQPFPKEMKPDIDILLDRYDEFIRYCDMTFEGFISGLKKRHLLDNSIVILSADHGESFKLRYLEHGFTHLYEQVTHIPLIIKEPDQKDGKIIDEFVEQVDIPSTLLDLANIDMPVQMEGQSLKPLLRGNSIINRPAYSVVFTNNRTGDKITTGTIAVSEGDYKLIHFISEDESLLYNLKKDPEEENNLFEIEPKVASHLLNLTYEKLNKINKNR